MPNIVKPSGVNQLWAAGGTKVNPGLQKLNIGWVVELPPYQYQNWLDNRQDTFIAHINQHGIPEWDAETEYQGNLSYTQGSNGIIYKCISTNTNFNPTNPLNSLYWAVAFEVAGAAAVVQSQLTQHLTNYATLTGITNPVAARNNLSVYSKVESDSRFAGLNGSAAQVFTVAVATQPEHAVRLGQVASLLTQATESNLGVVRIATSSATETGTDDLTAISPLKANSVFLKKSGNLAGLGNTATARANLGLGTAAVFSDTAFLKSANNLSEVASPSVARANLGLTSTATQPETYFLRGFQNLADVANVATARTNLGLGSSAVRADSFFLQSSNNLSDLSNVPVARNNLGLADTATLPSTTFLSRANNLSDLTNVQAARNRLNVYTTQEVNNLAIGVQQTWQNVRGSRQAGFTYTNNTTGPITVLVQHDALNSTAILYLNGIALAYQFSGTVTGTTGILQVVIPVGDTYSVNLLPNVWLELR